MLQEQVGKACQNQQSLALLLKPQPRFNIRSAQNLKRGVSQHASGLSTCLPDLQLGYTMTSSADQLEDSLCVSNPVQI